MATVRRRPNGSFEIRFYLGSGERKSFYLDSAKSKTKRKATLKDAEAVGQRLDKLVFAAGQSTVPKGDVADWLAKLPPRQYQRLVDWQLVPPRVIDEPEEEPSTSIGEWIESYLSRGQRKPGTREQLRITGENLKTFFGAEKPLAALHSGDAEDFRIWLQTQARGEDADGNARGLAHNTVRRRIGRTKQMFAAAVKRKLIEANPFADEIAATGANTETHQFIPHEWIERCIRAAPCEDWRIILALARYAGCRSHETRIQRWADIDIPKRRMLIRSNKTPPTRVVPIFPELMPHLMRAREMAPEGAEFVQTRYRADANIQTQLKRIIEAAGLVVWPDIMQNLRRSRETELMARYPAKDVASWIGNSVPIAMRHYAMVMEDSFTRAIAEGAGQASRPVPPQIPPAAAASDTQGSPDDQGERGETQQFAESFASVTTSDERENYPARVRKPSDSPGDFTRPSDRTPADTPIPPDTAELLRLWNQLCPTERLEFLTKLRERFSYRGG